MKNGSSPRVRGTYCIATHLVRSERLIPACAGNMGISNLTFLTTPAHPRVCGEHARPSAPAY